MSNVILSKSHNIFAIKAILLLLVLISAGACKGEDETTLLLLPLFGGPEASSTYGSDNASPVTSPEENGDTEAPEEMTVSAGAAGETPTGEESTADNSDRSDSAGEEDTADRDSSARPENTDSCLTDVQLKTLGNRWHTRAETPAAVHTYWSNQKLQLTVQHSCAQKQVVRLAITARNVHGPLPASYANFRIKAKDAARNQFLGYLDILASDDKDQTGYLELELAPGKQVWHLIWTNDKYKKGVYDANIQIKAVQLDLLDAGA